MTPDERAALRNTDPVPRAWFWPTSRLQYRWRPLDRGSDEFGRRTVGVRVPGGIWWVALWRFDDFSGPCARCKQWEPTEAWEAPHCHSCSYELADYERGCLCPSFLEEEFLDEEWPDPRCEVHAGLVSS